MAAQTKKKFTRLAKLQTYSKIQAINAPLVLASFALDKEDLSLKKGLKCLIFAHKTLKI